MDSASLEEICTCGICFELFNEDDRCPRVLTCGHTFCHSCLKKILKQSPSCPTCKTAVEVGEVELVPVNFIAKCITSVVRHDCSRKLTNSSSPTVASIPCSGKLASEGYCSEHSNFKELRCMNSEAWICGICAILNHKHCRIMLVKEAYEELQTQFSDKVNKELEAREDISENLAENLLLLHRERNDLIDDIHEKETELKEKENLIEELETRKSEEHKFCQKLKDLKTSMQNSTDGSEFSKFLNELDDLLDKGKRQIAQLSALEFTNPLTIESMKILCERQSVYVVEGQDKPLYGMVRINHGQIWISSFQPEKPTARLFQFKKILSQFEGSSELPKQAYLKLTPAEGENEDVEVVIETDGCSPRARNFILLCSALKGKSYRGLPFDYCNNLLGSYYHLNPGPLPIVPSISDNDSKTQWKEGLVFGMFEGNSYLNIVLEVKSAYSDFQIGAVTSGLQKLKELCKKRKNLMVNDCGLIIRP